MVKKYDGLFIFGAAVKDDALDGMLATVKIEITKLGGRIDSTDIVGRRTFARPMQKRENGVYVKMRFNLEAGQVDALTRRFKLSEDVFRVQFLLVDERREAAVAASNAAQAKREEAPVED